MQSGGSASRGDAARANSDLGGGDSSDGRPRSSASGRLLATADSGRRLARTLGGSVIDVASGIKGVGEKGIMGALTGVTAGLKSVASSGRGFREFLLKGPVVELAVAVVVGMAFTDLVNAIVKSFITPLIAAIFRGVSFEDLYFEVNSSRFVYGAAINAIIVFLLVLAFTYWGIMRPLQHFTNLFYPNRAETKDCPRCLSEIPLAATRCCKCIIDIEITAEEQEEIDKRAEERFFSGKGLCGCAPCFAVGRGAVAASKSVTNMVRLGSKGAQRVAGEEPQGDIESGAPAKSCGKPEARGGDPSGSRGGAGGGPVMSSVELVVDDGPAASAVSQGGLSGGSWKSAKADPVAAAGADEPAAAPQDMPGLRPRFF